VIGQFEIQYCVLDNQPEIHSKLTFSSTVGLGISKATEAKYSTGLWITGEVPTGIVLWYAVDITNSRREVVWRAVTTVGTSKVW